MPKTRKGRFKGKSKRPRVRIWDMYDSKAENQILLWFSGRTCKQIPRDIFCRIFRGAKGRLTFNCIAECLADFVHASTDVREQFGECGISPALYGNWIRQGRILNSGSLRLCKAMDNSIFSPDLLWSSGLRTVGSHVWKRPQSASFSIFSHMQ